MDEEPRIRCQHCEFEYNVRFLTPRIDDTTVYLSCYVCEGEITSLSVDPEVGPYLAYGGT